MSPGVASWAVWGTVSQRRAGGLEGCAAVVSRVGA